MKVWRRLGGDGGGGVTVVETREHFTFSLTPEREKSLSPFVRGRGRMTYPLNRREASRYSRKPPITNVDHSGFRPNDAG